MHVPSMQPVFKLELNHKVVPGIVTVGKYDGTHMCLTAAAGFDKVIIHNAHGGGAHSKAQRSAANSEVSELNVSQAVTTLAAGPLRPGVARDVLLIGSPSQILAYDVYDNSDLFYKDAPDGVNVIIVGYVDRYKEPVAVVGGSSSVLGLDHEGTEVFWSVVGGSVQAIILFDFDKDGENELIIGCSDSFIRVLKSNQVMVELAETGSVLCLTQISDVRFAYAVSNGTIGVYEDGTRLWRVKSKQNAVQVQWSGEALAACWSNGRVDWRDGQTGRVVRRVQMRSDAAAMQLADYRSVGVPDLVCVSQRGEVIGYPPYQDSSPGAAFTSGLIKKPPSEEQLLAITELFNKKQALMVELQHYEANAAVGSTTDNLDRPSETMPANTRMQVALTADAQQCCVELSIATNNDTVVRAALVLAEGIFPKGGEMLARHPPTSQLRSHLTMMLRPPRDVPVDIHVKAFLGYPNSEQFHIFELTKQLPRFSMYTLIPPTLSTPVDTGYVTFKITERVQRICIWINQNFLLENEIELDTEDTKELHLDLLCLRNETPLKLDIEVDGQVKFSTHDVRLAGNLIQSLAIFLNLSDLQSTASFPKAEETLRSEMSRASELGETRARLAADTAERAQLLTALLPAAQQAGSYNLKEMLSGYREVVSLNEELISACHARRANQQEALAALQHLHQILQQAARLRVGKYSRAVVVASRKAVRDDNVEALIKTLKVGDSSLIE